MAKSKFKNRTIGETIILLCQRKGEPVFKNGKVQQSALYRETKVDQSLISRLIKGPIAETSTKNVESFANYFCVSNSQMRGEDPIEGIDTAYPLNKAKQELMDMMDQIDDPEVQDRFLKHIKSSFDLFIDGK